MTPEFTRFLAATLRPLPDRALADSEPTAREMAEVVQPIIDAVRASPNDNAVFCTSLLAALDSPDKATRYGAEVLLAMAGRALVFGSHRAPPWGRSKV